MATETEEGSASSKLKNEILETSWQQRLALKGRQCSGCHSARELSVPPNRTSAFFPSCVLEFS